MARALASAYRRLGLLEDEAGQTQSGVANVGRALRQAERLVGEDAGDLGARRLLASAHDAAGLSLRYAGATAIEDVHAVFHRDEQLRLARTAEGETRRAVKGKWDLA